MLLGALDVIPFLDSYLVREVISVEILLLIVPYYLNKWTTQYQTYYVSFFTSLIWLHLSPCVALNFLSPWFGLNFPFIAWLSSLWGAHLEKCSFCAVERCMNDNVLLWQTHGGVISTIKLGSSHTILIACISLIRLTVSLSHLRWHLVWLKAGLFFSFYQFTHCADLSPQNVNTFLVFYLVHAIYSLCHSVTTPMQYDFLLFLIHVESL